MEDIITWEDLPFFIEEVRTRARSMLRKEWKEDPIHTTAHVLTALRRQRRTDQDWCDVTWEDRKYFFGAMYKAMERALIDHSRRREAQKRAPIKKGVTGDIKSHSFIIAFTINILSFSTQR